MSNQRFSTFPVSPFPGWLILGLAVWLPVSPECAADALANHPLPSQNLQVLLRDDFKTDQSVKRIPATVRRALFLHNILLNGAPPELLLDTKLLDSPGLTLDWMAEPNHDFDNHPKANPFNCTVRPSRRLGFVSVTKDYCVLQYEDTRPRVALFQLSPDGPATLVAVIDLDRPVKKLDELQKTLRERKYVVENASKAEL